MRDYAAQRLAVLDALGSGNSRAEVVEQSIRTAAGVNCRTLMQDAVAAEAIARGDLLFALYLGDRPPG